MDFSYSEEQREVKALAEKILGDHTEPAHLSGIEQGDDRFDEKLWSALAQAGLLGVGIDEEYGGMGFGFESLCLLVEEVGRTVAPAPVIPVLVSAAASLQKFAPVQLKELYLPAVASGQALLSAALVEVGNENMALPGCRAEQTDGQWRLDGEKHCVPFASRADGILLSAATDDGLGVFLLEPQAAGVELTKQAVTAGETQFVMSMNNAAATLVAQGSEAQAMVNWMFEATAAALSAMAVGLCDKMMRMTASYTSERKQFGVPIATFQAVGHQQANSFIDIECLRLVSQQAISLLDRGSDASEAVLVAKIWTGDVTHRVSQNSQQCHGGIGVDRDYPLYRYCLWARQIELSCGSSAELLARLGEGIAEQFAA
jgi:alkylation response protein AidB-like acyl-CoA dehydrogenase